MDEVEEQDFESVADAEKQSEEDEEHDTDTEFQQNNILMIFSPSQSTITL